MAFDQVATDAQQEERTKRLFIAALDSALNINDQSYAEQDGYVANPTRQYQVLGGQGYGVEGSAFSQGSQAAAVTPLMIMAAVAVVAYLALR